MFIRRFIARQFRNLTHVDVACEPALNVLIGNNAQGKTNFIEGIFVLSTLSTFRHAKNSQLIQAGRDAAQLEAAVEQKGKHHELKVRIHERKRTAIVDEKPVEASKYISHLKTVVFSPESLMAIKGGAELRRDLVDEAVFQVSTSGARSQWEFNRALKQRNALLKQIRDGQVSLSYGRGLLESLDLLYIDAASRVTFERKEFINNIYPLIHEVLGQILGDQEVSLRLEYEDSRGSWLDAGSHEQIRERFLGAVGDAEKRRAEEALGVSLTGPHRHDLRFIFNGNDSRIFASQGQQRALILSFKIAEILYHGKTFGSFPVLLLDDVLSELDEAKRNYLIEFLQTNEAQTFITTTELSSAEQLKGNRCAVFSVGNGKVLREE